jgi:hypothetical protein
MLIEAGEALDIFAKWLDEGSKIRLQGTFPTFVFGLWGRIVSLDSSQLRVISDIPDTEFSIRLDTEGIAFGYGDDRIAEGEEKKFSECIVIIMNSEREPYDTIAMAALKS